MNWRNPRAMICVLLCWSYSIMTLQQMSKQEPVRKAVEMPLRDKILLTGGSVAEVIELTWPRHDLVKHIGVANKTLLNLLFWLHQNAVHKCTMKSPIMCSKFVQAQDKQLKNSKKQMCWAASHLALQKKMTARTEFLITDLPTRYIVCLAQGVQS